MNNGLVKKLPAQQGIASPFLIAGAVIVGLIVLGVASGAVKFSGYVKYDDKKDSPQTESTSEETATPTPEPTPEAKLNPEAFVDEKGFTISYPEGWKLRDETAGGTMYKPSDTKPGQGEALVGVYVGPAGELADSKLSTIGDIHKAVIKQQFSSVNVLDEKETKIGDLDAYQIDFTGSINGEELKGKYFVVKSGSDVYAIIGTANAGMWGDYEDDIDASIQTFKLN